jgi:putative DNA methylase
MTETYRKKLIEVALPLEAINKEASREKSIRHGHPSTLHLWWARRPLAAARGVLFGQLVDDPSSWPEYFPTEEDQNHERQRLFRIIEDLIKWDNTDNQSVINAARLEIARSAARGDSSDGASSIMAANVTQGEINQYLKLALPPIHDPFAGGGTIPLEAQRLGLCTVANDLNPVAVIINKALVEIPPRFAGRGPINPENRSSISLSTWVGSQGLAEDVRYYGSWMRDQAQVQLQHLYPQADLPQEYGGGKTTVIAWLWARTVASPNPALGRAYVPLVSSFWLSKKSGRETWIEPIVEPDGRSYRFEVRTGKPTDPRAIDQGTKLARGANFRCLLSDVPLEPGYIKAEGQAGRMRARLMAMVTEWNGSRVYLAPAESHEVIALSAAPEWAPEGTVPERLTGGTCYAYVMTKWGDLFTKRQLVALTTLSDLIGKARERAVVDAVAAGLPDDRVRLSDGGRGATAYGDAIAVYLACCVDKCTLTNTTQATWQKEPDRLTQGFSRQAIPMTWDYAEANPLSSAGGGFGITPLSLTKVLERLPEATCEAIVEQKSATARASEASSKMYIISTDPPYYDNIAYADLSDYFYVWMRRSLKAVFPKLFSTVLVPKDEELVASQYRHGGREQAEEFFLNGMRQALKKLNSISDYRYPVTVYYAFRQSETVEAGTVSTGWETFLEALIQSGFSVVGTWPVRTELTANLKKGVNALASSIVLVCRKRLSASPSITRQEFRRLLKLELPLALAALQQGNIAPVDFAQASIGPGMGIFSRYASVLEADGSLMSVRSALQLINRTLDEHLTAEEADIDSDTRFAITWYEQHGWDLGEFGEAQILARARNVSVAGIVEAGIIDSAAGRVRLLTAQEQPDGWTPSQDGRLTVWEATQHLIKRLEESESRAADLLKQLGPVADKARDLAYRLYSICERRGWAEDARAYNSLVVAWPELERLAATIDSGPQSQSALFE